ncbi:MAG: hypothetical protein K0S65_6337 [Labilithrix sp.]|nr:hypothetical protein [Labilithrix sp.]
MTFSIELDASEPRPPFAPSGPRHRGPPLTALAVVHASLFVASLAITTALAGGAHFPSPFQPADISRAYYSEHAEAVKTGALLQFGASIPLGIFTATIVSRLRFLGIEVAGVFISLFGGFAASAALASSALAQWVLSQPEISMPTSITSGGADRALHLLAFAFGGPGYVVPFGLLIAGVAVTGGLHRLLPMWLMWSGLVVAVLAELSTLSLRLPLATVLLPLARFPGLVWIVWAAAVLPASRSRKAERSTLVAR